MFPSKYDFCIKKYIFLWLFSFCIQSIELNPNQLPAAVGFFMFIIGSQLPFFTIIKVSLLSSLQSQLKRGDISSSEQNTTRFVIFHLLRTVPSNTLIRSRYSLFAVPFTPYSSQANMSHIISHLYIPIIRTNRHFVQIL